MKKNKLLSAVLSLFLLVPASITWAQTVSSQKGLTTAVFKLQQGVIKIYLPDDIRPGDIISGRVIAEPVGKNAKQISNNLAELNSYSIHINNEKFPVDNAGKPFQISIPAGKPNRCLVGLTNAAGTKTAEVTVPSIPEKDQPGTTGGCNIPSQALTGSPFRITGPFDGNSSNTNCTLDNKPVEILAESPRECIVSYPSTAGGMHTFNNQESGQPPCSKQVTGVEMNITAGELNLTRGQQTYIDIKITNLLRLPDTALLTLTNISTNVITMTDGNNIAISIPPPSNSTNGTYTRRFNVQSIKTGAFKVNVSLDLPEAGSTEPVSTTIQTQPSLYNIKLRMELDGNDVSVESDGQNVETKEKEKEQIYIFGNTIRIFFNGLFIGEFDVTNPDNASMQEILSQYSDVNYPAPDIDCDSLTRICNKTAAFNVFWGDVYSVFEGKAESRTVKGETVENASNNSLLITRGWEIDCCTGEYKLKLFFQAMHGGTGNGSYNVTFSKILRTGKRCPIKCPDCKKKCDELKKLMEKVEKEREEIRKKNEGS